MTQQKGFSAIEILVALAVLVILAGGVWMWRDQKGTAVPALPQTTPILPSARTTIPTISPTVSLAATQLSTPIPSESTQAPKDYRTYTNEKYSYEIHYPPEAQTDEGSKEYFAIYLGKEGTLAGSYSTLNIQVAENPKGLSRRYFLADWLGESPEGVLANVKIDNAVIGGVDALRIVLDGGWWQGTSAKTVYIVPRGLRMYLIWNDQYWGGRKEPNSVFELNKGTFFKEIEIILSTFKFLD